MSNFAAALKNELRVRMKSLREQIADRRGKSLMIAERLCSSEMYKSAEVIAFYLNIGSEVETKDMIQKAQEEGKTVALPRVEGDCLVMYRYEAGDALVRSLFGVPEPEAVQDRIMPPEEISLVIVPGLCFDRNGGRLGYGKGFYDRFLSECSGKSVAVCFEGQLLDTGIIPETRNDVRMEHIITENIIIDV